MRPEAPTKHPATIKAVFVSKTPAEAAAIPEREFKSDMTTGISPPPIGITNASPDIIETIRTAMNIFLINSKSKFTKPNPLRSTWRIAIKINTKHTINNHFENLLKASFEPL